MIAGNPEESPDFMSKAPGNSWETWVYGKCSRKYTAL